MNWGLLPFDQESLEDYLKLLYQKGVEVTDIRKLGENKNGTAKRLSQDAPLLISFMHGHESEQVVLRTVLKDGLSRERRADWSCNLLANHDRSKELSHHEPFVNIGTFAPKSKSFSLEQDNEFFLITPYVSGVLYAQDLCQISDTQNLEHWDKEHVVALADYLAEIHAVKKSDMVRYQQRIRNLLGYGEGLMGILDSYYSDPELTSPGDLEEIEKQCVAWRWRSKGFHHRLSHVHGDFHPWNVQFQEDSASMLLDYSKSQWGEPADDVSAMTISYILFSLRREGALTTPFRQLYSLFWEHYLGVTQDQEILRIIQPFYVWRVLAAASPVWSSSLSLPVRKMLLRFVKNMLASEDFDPERIDDYFG
jgi:hypothetical protein